MAASSRQSSRAAQNGQRSDRQGLNGARLIRLSAAAREAVLTIMRYIALATGQEPTEEEIAAVLKSYFTLNEVSNQIAYLRKKPADGDEVHMSGTRILSLRINLGALPPKNSLARAGFFIPAIGEGIAAIRRHARSVHGVEPDEKEVAGALRSSFILSELKNQIVHSRRHPHKKST